MPLQLPTPTSASAQYDITLDGVDFTLLYNWNVREESWNLTITDLPGNAIINGVKIVPLLGLFTNHPQTNLPLGNIVAVPVNPEGELRDAKITRDNLGTVFMLVYYTKEEISVLED